MSFEKTNTGGSGGGGGTPYPQDPTQNMLFLADDFIGGARDSTTAQMFGQFSWATASVDAGGFAINNGTITTSLNHPGVLAFTSSTNNNDAVGIYTGHQSAGAANTAFFLGSGAIKMRALCYVNALSNGTNNTMIAFGLCDSPAWNGPTQSCRIIYEYEVDTTHWVLQTEKSGTTTQTSGTVVVATGWNWLEIDVNAAGTSVSMTVNGTVAATNTTNIPTVGMPFRFDMRKTLGTTANVVGLDYIDLSMGISR